MACRDWSSPNLSYRSIVRSKFLDSLMDVETRTLEYCEYIADSNDDDMEIVLPCIKK